MKGKFNKDYSEINLDEDYYHLIQYVNYNRKAMFADKMCRPTVYRPLYCEEFIVNT